MVESIISGASMTQKVDMHSPKTFEQAYYHVQAERANAEVQRNLIQRALKNARPNDRADLETRLREAQTRFDALDAQWLRARELRVSFERQGVMWSQASLASAGEIPTDQGLSPVSYGLGAAFAAVLLWSFIRRRAGMGGAQRVRIAKLERQLDGLETDVAHVQASQRFTEDLLRGGVSARSDGRSPQ